MCFIYVTPASQQTVLVLGNRNSILCPEGVQGVLYLGHTRITTDSACGMEIKNSILCPEGVQGVMYLSHTRIATDSASAMENKNSILCPEGVQCVMFFNHTRIAKPGHNNFNLL